MLQLISIIFLIISFAIGIHLKNKKKFIHPEYTESRLKLFHAPKDATAADPDKVLAVIMELDHEGGRATTIVYEDGHQINLATSQAPVDKPRREVPDYVQEAAKELMERGKKLLAQAIPSSSLDFPLKNHVSFHIITSRGRFALSDNLVKASNKKNPLYPLYDGFINYSKSKEIEEHSKKFASGSQYVVIEDE